MRKQLLILASVVAFAATATFIAFCLILARSTALGQSGDLTLLGPAGEAGIPAALRSGTAVVVYCILLAGTLGSAIRLMVDRFGRDQKPNADELSWVDATVRLFVGAVVAFITAFLVPLAVVKPQPVQAPQAVGTLQPAGPFARPATPAPSAVVTHPIDSAYNPWALLIIAAVTGYASRGLLKTFQRQIVDELRQALSATILEADVSRSVTEGVERALSMPKPVNYDGTAFIDVVNESGVSLFESPVASAPVTREPALSDELQLSIRPSSSYRVRVSFVPSGIESDAKARPARIPIAVTDGVAASRVPFDVIVDAGVAGGLYERSVEVPRTEQYALDDIVFSLAPETSVERVSQPPADPDFPPEEIAKELRVKVYQSGDLLSVYAARFAP